MIDLPLHSIVAQLASLSRPTLAASVKREVAMHQSVLLGRYLQAYRCRVILSHWLRSKAGRVWREFERPRSEREAHESIDGRREKGGMPADGRENLLASFCDWNSGIVTLRGMLFLVFVIR